MYSVLILLCYTCISLSHPRRVQLSPSHAFPGTRANCEHQPNVQVHKCSYSVKAQLELDLHINPGRQVQLHELVNGLCCQVANVDQPRVRPCLKVLPGVLVHVGRSQHTVDASPEFTQQTSEEALCMCCKSMIQECGKAPSHYFLATAILYQTH